jgi:hypothetical protein
MFSEIVEDGVRWSDGTVLRADVILVHWISQLPRSSGAIDATLTPPGTQYGATQGKTQKRNPLKYGPFANSCNPLQRMKYHP